MEQRIFWQGPGWYASQSDSLGTSTHKLQVVNYQRKLGITKRACRTSGEAWEVAQRDGLGTPMLIVERPEASDTVTVYDAASYIEWLDAQPNS